MAEAKAAPKEEVTAKKQMEQPPAATGERKVRELDVNRMQECEFKRTVWVVTAHENTEPEDLLNPEYWSHNAERLRPFAKIEARADDGSWYAEYLVLESSRRWARLHLLCKHNLSTPDVSLSQAKFGEYLVEFRGPERQWSVVSKATKEVMREGEQTEAAAYRWLSERIRAGI